MRRSLLYLSLALLPAAAAGQEDRAAHDARRVEAFRAEK